MKRVKYLALVLLMIASSAIVLLNLETRVANAGPLRPQPSFTHFEHASEFAIDDEVPAAYSYDGRYIGFNSESGNYVSGDTNSVGDAFIYDKLTDTYERVGLDDTGNEFPGGSFLTNMSSNGRFITFVADYNSNTNATVLRDLQTGINILVSSDSSGNFCYLGSGTNISDDGVYVLFNAGSAACGMSPAIPSSIYLKNTSTGNLAKVSTSLLGHSWQVTAGHMSADGSRIAIKAKDLTAGGPIKVIVNTIATGSSVIISDPTGGTANNDASVGSLSRNGNLVLFGSLATNLDPATSHGSAVYHKLYLYDMGTSAQEHLDFMPSGGTWSGGSFLPTNSNTMIADDGRYVGYASYSTKLDATNSPTTYTPKTYSLYVYDRQTDSNKMISNQIGDRAYYAPGDNSFVTASFDQIDIADTDTKKDIYVVYSAFPDNYLSYIKAGVGLQIIKSDGTGDKTLLNNSSVANLSNPQLSLDRRKVYFIGGSDSHLYSVMADGTYVTDLGYSLGVFSISPDGTKVVSVGSPTLNSTDHEYYPTIKIMGIDGTNPTTVDLPQAGAPAQMQWTNDGNSLVFQLREKDDNGEWNDCNIWIAKIDIDETDFSKLTPDDCVADANPSINPDNDKIAWNAGPGEVWVMNADGSSAIEIAPGLTSGILLLNRPSWSPDGTQIAVDYKDSGMGSNQKLGILNASTGALTASGPNTLKVTYIDWTSSPL